MLLVGMWGYLPNLVYWGSLEGPLIALKEFNLTGIEVKT
jgi:hypothetical protein